MQVCGIISVFAYKEMGQTEESKFYFDRARDIHLWKKDTPIIPHHDEILKKGTS